MDKKTVILGMLLGSTIGGYLPTFFGASAFSFSSIIGGAIGGFFGIWLSFRLLN
jgi:hypothetical protein